MEACLELDNDALNGWMEYQRNNNAHNGLVRNERWCFFSFFFLLLLVLACDGTHYSTRLTRKNLVLTMMNGGLQKCLSGGGLTYTFLGTNDAKHERQLITGNSTPSYFAICAFKKNSCY